MNLKDIYNELRDKGFLATSNLSLFTKEFERHATTIADVQSLNRINDDNILLLKSSYRAFSGAEIGLYVKGSKQIKQGIITNKSSGSLSYLVEHSKKQTQALILSYSVIASSGDFVKEKELQEELYRLHYVSKHYYPSKFVVRYDSEIDTYNVIYPYLMTDDKETNELSNYQSTVAAQITRHLIDESSFGKKVLVKVVSLDSSLVRDVTKIKTRVIIESFISQLPSSETYKTIIQEKVVSEMSIEVLNAIDELTTALINSDVNTNLNSKPWAEIVLKSSERIENQRRAFVDVLEKEANKIREHIPSNPDDMKMFIASAPQALLETLFSRSEIILSLQSENSNIYGSANKPISELLVNLETLRAINGKDFHAQLYLKHLIHA